MSRFAESQTDAKFDIAAAKAVTSRAALEVVTHAHQIHGAIGMTQEYPLHDFTRRLMVWEWEWGSERLWVDALGRDIFNSGDKALWPQITNGLAEVHEETSVE
jgi:acyl-CoA dehydrogenase